MIIFGTRGLTSTAGSGQFHCPRCGPQRTYNTKQVKNWFTLYFIPVIPLGTAGEYLECTNCAATFGTDVINYDPQAEQDRVLDEIKRLLILAALAQGPPDDAKVLNIQNAYASLTNVHLMPEEISREFRLAQSASANFASYARGVAGNFNEKSKELLLAAAGSILSPSGNFSSLDVPLLTSFGAALGMGRPSIEAVLRQLQQGRLS